MQYLDLLRRRWAVLFLCALLGGACAFGLSARKAPQYQATATVFLSPSQGQTIGELAQGSSYTRGLVQSYVRLTTTPTVLEPVIAQLGLDTTPQALAGRVSAETELDTVLIDITATSGSPAEAADVANAVSAQLSQATGELSPAGRGDTTAITVTTVAPATVPSSPSSPQRTVDVALGLAIGLLLGIAGAVSAEVLNTRVRDEYDVLDVSDVPILASLGTARGNRGTRHAARGESVDPRVESVRRLRTNLRLLAADGAPQRIVIAAAGAGRGSAAVAVELAVAMADPETRVLLVEGDLRNPSLAEVTGTAPTAGLVGVLTGRAPLAGAVQQWGSKQLGFLPAGAVPPNPDELLGSTAMRRLLADLRADHDVVLVTAPPVLSVADAAILAAHVDGTVVTVDTRRTTRRQLEESLRDLHMVKAHVLGVVLDGASSRRRGSAPAGTSALAPARGAVLSLRPTTGGGERAPVHHEGA
ncbi:polysaccharide biosynthesis tyrosine autokinase [Kineococcus glutinatus]